jgi:ubiquinone/menaquinone biosynthesis C-methylase UbiE
MCNIKKKKVKKCIFKYYNGSKIPYKDNKFNFITILQVLHHVKEGDLKILLKDIKRVIKPKGYLLIREHNLNNKNLKILIDIEHGMCEMFVLKNLIKIFLMIIMLHIKTIKNGIILKNGFKLVKKFFFKSKYNITNYYNAIYIYLIKQNIFYIIKESF